MDPVLDWTCNAHSSEISAQSEYHWQRHRWHHWHKLQTVHWQYRLSTYCTCSSQDYRKSKWVTTNSHSTSIKNLSHIVFWTQDKKDKPHTQIN